MNSPNPYRILVVCVGNICRSPVAEEILRSKLEMIGGFDVESAGLSAPIGLVPDPLALVTAKELGYFLSPSQRSKPVANSSVEAAQLILVMERRHRAALCERFPYAVGKVFLIGHWGQGEIKDPVGRDLEFFRETATQLSRCAEAWCERLKKITTLVADKSSRQLEQRVE